MRFIIQIARKNVKDNNQYNQSVDVNEENSVNIKMRKIRKEKL